MFAVLRASFFLSADSVQLRSSKRVLRSPTAGFVRMQMSLESSRSCCVPWMSTCTFLPELNVKMDLVLALPWYVYVSVYRRVFTYKHDRYVQSCRC
jgi:hypothetical protein